jgi:hypothetical protein
MLPRALLTPRKISSGIVSARKTPGSGFRHYLMFLAHIELKILSAAFSNTEWCLQVNKRSARSVRLISRLYAVIRDQSRGLELERSHGARDAPIEWEI